MLRLLVRARRIVVLYACLPRVDNCDAESYNRDVMLRCEAISEQGMRTWM